ncbi:MAG: nucleotidyltransferase [Bacilli bacterium]|nr:nucleotidyltransferase [Bacilli bacterium]
MEKDLCLVVMAAGMGSRFGGLKQIEPVGPSGEIIADYSVYDAIRAGFTKVVFIIRKEHLDYFKENITKKYEGKIKIKFAFQELDTIPNDVNLPSDRQKMLGTGHAIYCAKDVIDSDFVVINSDDFYGYDAFLKIKKYFDGQTDENEYITINYPISSVMSKTGVVKRGICFTENGYVTKMVESEVSFEDGKYIAKPLSGDSPFEITADQGAAMNFLGFHHKFLDDLEKEFITFIHEPITLTNEFLIPEVLSKLLKEGRIKGIEQLASSKWMGITYKDDLEEFKRFINELIANGQYPNNLWG